MKTMDLKQRLLAMAARHASKVEGQGADTEQRATSDGIAGMDGFASEGQSAPVVSELPPPITDVFTADDRRTAGVVAAWLARTFRLELTGHPFDPASSVGPLLADATERVLAQPYIFPVDQSEFVELDYDFPQPLTLTLASAEHPLIPAAAYRSVKMEQKPRESILRIRSISTAVFQLISVKTDALAPEIASGTRLAIDTTSTAPSRGDLVAVYVPGEGGLLGYWSLRGGRIALLRNQRGAAAMILSDRPRFVIWGTVAGIIESPVIKSEGPRHHVVTGRGINIYPVDHYAERRMETATPATKRTARKSGRRGPGRPRKRGRPKGSRSRAVKARARQQARRQEGIQAQSLSAPSTGRPPFLQRTATPAANQNLGREPQNREPKTGE